MIYVLQDEDSSSSWNQQPSYQDPGLSGPLAGENVMNVVLVGAECAPWSKTGKLCAHEANSLYGRACLAATAPCRIASCTHMPDALSHHASVTA